MDTISCSKARMQLARIMDRVNDERDGIIITRQNGASAVLMSLDDYESWQEAIHLLSSPENARRLFDSVATEKNGNPKVRELIGAKR